ncbi:MAG TPA: carboxypeptidase-like regulatory domain-containing protein [Chthoniobacterales bacterium]|nr:carboxypeptidase-like regulatory domain-containing protein [Chthoniobacterales bacterium]
MLRIFILLFGLTMAGALPASSAEPDAGIEGVISISPAHPGPTRVDEADSKPLANTEFVVTSEKGAVASFKTDDQGHFRVSLPPGHYTVSRKSGQSRIGRFGPFDVDLTAGQITKVQWSCDSGMR